MSDVRPSVFCKLLTFLTSSPKPPGIVCERNSTKLDRKQDLNVFYQVCVIGADHKNKMAALASDWLTHFRLLLWNRWTEFNETWQEANSYRPLPSFCFSGRSEKQDGRPGLWLAEKFSTSPLKPLNGIQRNLTGSKISMSSTKFVFFVLIGKKDGRPSLWLAETFSTSPLKPLNRIRWNLTGSKISTSFTKSVFFGRIGKKNGRHGPWLAETFLTPPLKLLNGIQRNLTESKISTSSTKLYFSVWWVNKNYRPGRSVKKVAHCTQVHDMWPFGPLVYVFI